MSASHVPIATAPSPTLPEGSILERVRALRPRIKAERATIEKERRLPAWLSQALVDTDVFRMGAPRAFGGPELDPLANVEVVEEISRGDASAGWCAMIQSGWSIFVAGHLQNEACETLFRDPKTVGGGFFAPKGIAVEAGDQYKVTGQFPYGSGCTHCTHLLAGCATVGKSGPVVDAHGRPEWRVVVFPQPKAEILHNWNLTGMMGTGSHDYKVDELAVPAGWTFRVEDGPARDEPLYRLPGMFLVNMPAVPLGIARETLEDFKNEASNGPMRDRYLAQLAASKAEAIIGSARAYLFDVVGEVWEALLAGDELDMDQRTRFRLALTNGFEQSKRAVDLIIEAAGTKATAADGPLAQVNRDMLVMASHNNCGPHTHEIIGRIRLGLDHGVYQRNFF